MLQASPSFYLFFAFLVLALPFDWLVAAVCAALIHEACHLAAVKCLGGKVEHIRVQVGGARISAWLPDSRGEILAALAGPAGSLLLLLTARCSPQLALCGGIQGAFNLLPIVPLDGGNALQMLLNRYIPAQADHIVEWIGILMKAGAGCFFLILGWTGMVGWVPALLGAGWICLELLRKKPCKAGGIKVQ